MHCVCCGGEDFAALPNPHAARSMASDFRVVAEPLNKHECVTCGAIARGKSTRIEFDGDYTLYAHAPGTGPELGRQRRYAQWVSTLSTQPRSLFEAGSGNGSLLLALAGVWPGTTLTGVEPASGAAASACAAGLAVANSALHAVEVPTSEVALAINVIEHVDDPVGFVRALASHASDGVIIIAPDGSRPSVELLIADHQHSFTPATMRMILECAELDVIEHVEAPSELGVFFATLARKPHGRHGERRITQSAAPDRRGYLNAWKNLEASLLERLGTELEVGCFGAGEAAALLRAYAPSAWSRVNACFVDTPQDTSFGDLAIHGMQHAPRTLLLGVRPQSQHAVSQRLESAGHRVIRWDDIVAQ